MKRYDLIRALTSFIPHKAKLWIKKYVSGEELEIEYRKRNNPFKDDSDRKMYPKSKWKLGIIKDVYHYHQHYIAACRELEVSYIVVDITKDDYIEQVKQNDCVAYLVWPSIRNSIVKELFDDRLAILVSELKKTIFPSYKENWIYENKLRMTYWLRSHNIPHPKTWIFYDKVVALKFAEDASLPIVFKTKLGAVSSGVRIVRKRRELKSLITQAFKKGILPKGHNRYDRQRGSVFLQEFLPNVEEWRMVRIGNSFYGYRKDKIGEFHSGSHKLSLLPPKKEYLDFLKKVTDKGNFRSMDLDVFVTEDGELLVNELQALFGAGTLDKMIQNHPEIEGRHIFENGDWVFEGGPYMRNWFCNMRVKFLLDCLENELSYS